MTYYKYRSSSKVRGLIVRHPIGPNKFKFDNENLHNSLTRDLITTSHFSLYKISVGGFGTLWKRERGAKSLPIHCFGLAGWCDMRYIPPEGARGGSVSIFLSNFTLLAPSHDLWRLIAVHHFGQALLSSRHYTETCLAPLGIEINKINRFGREWSEVLE